MFLFWCAEKTNLGDTTTLTSYWRCHHHWSRAICAGCPSGARSSRYTCIFFTVLLHIARACRHRTSYVNFSPHCTFATETKVCTLYHHDRLLYVLTCRFHCNVNVQPRISIQFCPMQYAASFFVLQLTVWITIRPVGPVTCKGYAVDPGWSYVV